MPITAVRSRPAHTARAARVDRAARPERVEKSNKAHRAPEAPRPEASAEKGRAHGVLRLLEAGHFKGVADVRLRINFHAEITQRQTAGVKEAAREGVAAVVEAVTEEVNTLVEAGGLDEDQAAALGDLVATFEAAAQDAETSFQEADQPDLKALTDALQGAFDTLHASLQTLLEPPGTSPEDAVENEAPTDTPVEEAPAVVAEDEEISSSIDFLGRLAEAFSDTLEELEASVITTDVLPPLSEPSGQGKAYARFVAQYEQLRASAGIYGSRQVDFSV